MRTLVVAVTSIAAMTMLLPTAITGQQVTNTALDNQVKAFLEQRKGTWRCARSPTTRCTTRPGWWSPTGST